MQLPASFITTIQNVYKEDGEKFLAVLPDLIQEASQRWDLTDVQPVPNLSYHFVAFAKQKPSPVGRGQGEGDVVLKMGIPNPELTSEISALKLFNGNGACQLLESDEEHGFLLLERLKPGIMLSELDDDDDERTIIAAEVMQKIWREAPSKNNFGSLGIAVIDQHIWRCGVSRIGNPTYIWRCVTENPREP